MLAAACVMGAGLMGCRSDTATSDAPALGSEAESKYPVYPAEAVQERVLDVQAIRESTQVTITNTSASALPPGRLWFNAGYSLPFDGLGVAQTRTYSLAEARDQYGTRFRAGGFFATEFPVKVVLTQIESDGRLIGLLSIERAP